MIFDIFDKEMRVFEQSLDQCIIPDMYLIARLDGHKFTNFTNRQNYNKPFDASFRNLMMSVTEDLVRNSNFKIVYAYTQSDEISLLFANNENSFGRKTRKINSLLASRASAVASLIVGEPVQFDCRVVPLPSMKRVTDYFSWRAEDAARNALNGYCYWTARNADHMSTNAATKMLESKGVDWKHDYLYQHNIIFGDGKSQTFLHVPRWQKRGIAFHWEWYEREGFNPKTGKRVMTQRRRIVTDIDLTYGDQYKDYVRKIVEAQV